MLVDLSPDSMQHNFVMTWCSEVVGQRAHHDLFLTVIDSLGDGVGHVRQLSYWQHALLQQLGQCLRYLQQLPIIQRMSDMISSAH